MKTAICGLGYWGSKLLRNLVGIVGAQNVVAVDSHVGRLEDAVSAFPGITARLSLDEALADPEVGAVLVATPLGSHVALATQVLEAGRHVFVEKPLAPSLEEARTLVALAEANDRVLMTGHTFLFSPAVNKVREVNLAGELGRPLYATSQRLNLGLYRPDANVIWDLAPHDISILCHILDEAPAEVQTTARCSMHPNLPDVAFINLTFPSGAIGQVNVSWLAPKKLRSTVVVGEAQMAVIDEDTEDPVRLYDRGVTLPDPGEFELHKLTYRYGDTVSPFIPAAEPLSLELRHFLECCESGTAGWSGPEFSLAVVAAVEAADLSWMRGGKPVEVDAIPAVPTPAGAATPGSLSRA